MIGDPIRQVIAKTALATASRAVPAGVVSTNAINRLARLGPPQDPFGVDTGQPKASTGRSLPDGELSTLFADLELGAWSLGPRSMSWIRDLIFQRRPKVILEFGSGISTVCLAKFGSQANPGAPWPVVVSIEQSLDFANETNELLRRAGLDQGARVVVAPVEEQFLEGVLTSCYRMPPTLGSDLPPAELVLIDGPAGPSGVRLGTLPLARNFASTDARFVLDDALRAGELAIASVWNAWPWVEIWGLIPIEKGLLTGRLQGLG